MAIDYSSSFDKTIPFSDTDYQFGLNANTALSFTLPGTYAQKYVLTFGLRSDKDLWVGYNVTAVVVPLGTVTNTQGIELITPNSQRFAIGGDIISLISPDAATYVGVSVRSITN